MRKSIFLMLLGLAATILVTGCGQEQMGSERPSPIKRRPRAAQPRARVSSQVETKRVAPQVAKTKITEVPKPAPAKQERAFYAKELIVADFDSGEKPNNLGGNFGAWDKDPADLSQGCTESFDTVNRYGMKGFGMKVDYDVDSTNPAYNGFWMFLQGLDASGYDALSFWAKGDPDGYTTVFKVELKNGKGEVGRYYVTDLADSWQKISIALADFRGISDFSDLTEFVIVFEDRIVSEKDGAIYIDEVTFTKK